MTKERPPVRAAFRERPNAAEMLALDRWMFSGLGAPDAWNLVRGDAFALVFDVPRAQIEFRPEAGEDWYGEVPSSILDGGIAVLDLFGPIDHHSCWYWNNYEDLTCEVEAALAHADVRKVVLRIDSPGGIAAGMNEAHKAIRRLSKQYGKDVIAYVDEQACSAAYHIASACSEIWMPESAQVGSVGVILCTVDETEALEKAGLRIRYVVTGKRKADLHPGAPVTDEVLRVAQQKVDYAGSLFFDAVAAARGLTPEKVRGYEAAVFCGQDAIKAGYADGLASWDRFLSLVRATVDDAEGVPPAKNAAAQALGRLGASKGGRATAEKYSPEQRSRRAKKAAKARWRGADARARVH